MKKRSVWKREKNRLNTLRRFVCMGLSLELALTTPFGLNTPVRVKAANDSTNVNDMTSLDALGISQDKPEDYDQNALNPYGKNVVQMQKVSELFTVESWDGTQTDTGHSVNVRYNQYGKNSTLLKGDASVLETPTQTKQTEKNLGTYIKETDNNANLDRKGYQTTVSIEGNFATENEGKKKQVVSIWPYVQSGSNNAIAMLDIVDASDPERQINSFIEGAKMAPARVSYEQICDWDWMGMVNLQAADFDGDGIDEIAYTTRDKKYRSYQTYDENVYLHVLKLQKQDSDGWMDAANWKEVFSTQIAYETFLYTDEMYIPNYATAVSVGDFNRDGVDDIATVCADYNPYMDEDATAEVTFFWGERAGDMLKRKSTMRLEQLENPAEYEGDANVSLALGDVDGDGDDEMIAAGVSNKNLFKRHIMIYDWNGEGFTLSASKTFDLFEKDNQGQYVNAVMNGRSEGEFYSITEGKANLAVGAFNGFGQPDAIYMDSLLFSYKDNDLELTGLYDKAFSVSGKDYVECNVRAADFDGDGTEVPVIQMIALADHKEKEMSFAATFDRKVQYAKGEQLDVAIPYLENSAGETAMKVKKYHAKNMSFALPDIDNDTSYLRYKNVHYYKYSDPKILAVLASPPFFKDLDNDAFDGAGELNCTSYATTKGTGSGTTSSDTFHIGAYVSYEHDITVFGVKVAQVEWETELQNQFTWETEKIATKEYEATYETLSGQDTVVLFSVPMETFEFEVDIPVTDDDGNVIKTNTETIGINLPHTPCVKTIALEKYERIAKDFNELPQISDSILTHTVGHPDTYPKQTSQLKHVDHSSEILVAPDMKSAAPATDYGKGAQTHSITMGNEKTNSFNYELGVDFKAGAGVGSFTAGISSGYTHSGGTVEISTSGYSYSAQIYDLPMEAEEAGYGFNWRMAAYKYKDADNEFPVVTYLVNDVQQGPLLPANFVQNEENTTKDQVALNWDYTGNPAGFLINKYYKSAGNAGFYEIAYVKSGDADAVIAKDGNTKTYQYIDEGLDPDTEYQYQIQTVSNQFHVKSVPSETLVCYTLPIGTVPDVKVMEEKLTAYPDTPATLTTYLNNEEALGGRRITYQWQKYDEAQKSWKDLTAKTESSLVIQNAGLDDEGLYRCIVNSRGGNSIVSAKSPVVEVTYSKRQVVCDSFTIDKKDNTVKLALKSKDSNSIPSGLVYFKLSGTGFEQEFMTGLDEKGVACAKMEVPDGAYKVTAEYQGSRVFSASHYDTADGKPLFYTPGLESNATVLDYAKSYTYGDKLNIMQYNLDKDGNVEKAEEIDYKEAVFGIQASTLVNTKSSCQPLEYAMTYENSLFDSKECEMADGTKALSKVIYKFQDPTIQFPDESVYDPDKTGEMRQKILERFADGYAAYAGTVYMKYKDQILTLDIRPKQIDLYVDLSGVPEIVNAGEEAEQYYSRDAVRSYLNSKEMPDFGKEGKKEDLKYLDARNLVTAYWGTMWTENATVSMEMKKDSSLDPDKPSVGGYSFKRIPQGASFTDTKNEFRYALDEHLGLYKAYNELGLNNDISSIIEVKRNGETVKAARLNTAVSIANCYEWQDFSQELIVSSGEMYPCTVTAAKVNGIEAGTVKEVSPALRTHYPVGTRLVFEASAYEGYEVDYWEVNGEKLKNETSGTLRISQTMEGTKAVVYFKRRPNVLNYDISPKNATVNGKAVENRILITPSVKNGAVITYGAKIKAEAVPAEGWHLKEWEYQPEKLAARFITDPIYEFEMPNKNVRLYANFERDSYKLTLAEGVTAFDPQGGKIESDAYVTGDTLVTIKKADGYEFKDEPAFTTSVETTDTDSDADTYTFAMLADTKVEANVVKDEYQITLGKTEHGELIVTDQKGNKVDLRQKIKGGTKLLVTAVPDRGYKVSAWNAKASDEESYNLIVSEDATVTATFTEKVYKEVAIGASTKGNYLFTADGERVVTAGGKLRVYANETVTVQALPQDNYMVAGWTAYRQAGEGEEAQKNYTATSEETQTLEYGDSIAKLSANFAPVNVVGVSGQTETQDGSLTLYSDNNRLSEADYIGVSTSLTCVASPKEGYVVSSWIVNGEAVENCKDTVLVLEDVKEDTQVTVSFAVSQVGEGKAVTEDETEEGKVFINTKEGIGSQRIPAGTRVYLTAAAKDGYEPEKPEVTKMTGETITLDNDNSFVMPEGNVSVKGSFKEIILHDHILVIDEREEPTCEKTGLTRGSHCSDCNEVIVAQEEIPALGHIEAIEKGKEAKCDEGGLTDKVYCSVCGKVIKDHEQIKPLGHDYVVIREGKPATYTEDGYTEIRECTRCGKKEGGATIHKLEKPGQTQGTTEPAGTVLKKAVLSSAKNNKTKAAMVKWKEVTGAKGYEVQYSTDKKFKKDTKVKVTKKLSLVIKKLKKDKTYYVRVRAFDTDASGKKIYGDFGKAKKVKIKK